MSLLEKINEEYDKCQSLYNNVHAFLTVIMAACYRAGLEYTIDESYKVDLFNTTEKIRDAFIDIEDDKEALTLIYNILINTLGDTYIKELAEHKVEPMSYDEVFDVIKNQLDYYDKINVETLIRMQTLQWVRNEIENEKETA